MKIKIGFSKTDITPPLGIELGGYAAIRRSISVHDPLYCKAIVLEQEGVLYVLLVMDLLCVDESLYTCIAQKLKEKGIEQRRLIVSAIHSHSAPRGVIPGEGSLAEINRAGNPKDEAYLPYIRSVVDKAACAVDDAAASLEPFLVRTAIGEAPLVGSERHTGEKPKGSLMVVECRTESGKTLMLYNFPCHPTVMSAANLEVSADFVAGIEGLLGVDMSVFVNGAAGDISTRFTRKESSFAECARMADISAEQIRRVLGNCEYVEPMALRGIQKTIVLRAREVENEEQAKLRVERLTANWKAAEQEGADPHRIRTLKSFAEGAGTNLQFARSMKDIREFRLPVTVFTFCGLQFVSVPGELFSSLLPDKPIVFICYANGYYRYLADEAAYEAEFYEALGAIVDRGEGERLIAEALALLSQLEWKQE